MNGWKPGFEQREGVQVQQAIWIHYWISPDKETEGKSVQSFSRTTGRLNSSKLEAWQRKLHDAGALNWTEEHWDSLPISKPLILNKQALDLAGNPLAHSATKSN